MKLLAIIIFFASCTAQRFMPMGQQQAKLDSWKNKGENRYNLTLLDIKGDTVHMLYGDDRMGGVRFRKGEWYTISYDSSRVKVINGVKYYECRIKRNS